MTETTTQTATPENEPEHAPTGAAQPERQQPLPPRNFDPEHRRETVSFVRRSGRMTDSQERAWEELYDTYIVEVPGSESSIVKVADDAETDPAELFGREAPLVVEVGTGQGHAILHAAEQHPDTNFFGIEVFRAGLARTMIRAEQAGLTNLRLAEANAPEVLDKFLPAGSVDEIRVFFPDPWRKARHHKRRIVSPKFAATVVRALKPGGVLRLATDWQEYADAMRDVLDEAPGLTRDFTGDWAERFEGRPLTAFENKGIKKGRDIRDLAYRSTAA